MSWCRPGLAGGPVGHAPAAADWRRRQAESLDRAHSRNSNAHQDASRGLAGRGRNCRGIHPHPTTVTIRRTLQFPIGFEVYDGIAVVFLKREVDNAFDEASAINRIRDRRLPIAPVDLYCRRLP